MSILNIFEDVTVVYVCQKKSILQLLVESRCTLIGQLLSDLFPDDVVTVAREQWRARFYADTQAREDKVTEDTLRKRFNRAILDLTGKQVETMGEWFWLA
jgi:hypothetical protein